MGGETGAYRCDLKGRRDTVVGNDRPPMHGSHDGRATVLGRRNLAHRERSLHHATRRSGTVALPGHEANNGKTTKKGRPFGRPFLAKEGFPYPFILSKNSLLLLVPSILLTRNSIASTELSGLSTRRSAHTFCITSLSRRRSSLRVPDALMSMAG